MFDYLLGGESSSTWKSTGSDSNQRLETKRENTESDEETREKNLSLDRSNDPTILMRIEIWIEAILGRTPLRYIFCSCRGR